MLIAEKPHPIYVTYELDHDFTQYGDCAVVITESRVKNFHLPKLEELLQTQGVHHDTLVLPSGEVAKDHRNLTQYYTDLAALDFNFIIALGGGAIGDTAGFLAATFRRGVPFVNVPTTLSSMLDASIGGKYALNIDERKNYIGAIKQPAAVVSATEFLRTLKRDGLSAGHAEAVKKGIVANRGLYRFIQDNHHAPDEHYLYQLVFQSALTKADVVAQQPQDTGIRHILNYGHTVGHAIEAAAKYRILHGRAVAQGMGLEGAIARYFGFSLDDYRDQQELLRALHLQEKPVIATESLIPLMRQDKKNRGDGIRFVIPTRIGSALEKSGEYSHVVPEELILAAKPI